MLANKRRYDIRVNGKKHHCKHKQKRWYSCSLIFLYCIFDWHIKFSTSAADTDQNNFKHIL